MGGESTRTSSPRLLAATGLVGLVAHELAHSWWAISSPPNWGALAQRRLHQLFENRIWRRSTARAAPPEARAELRRRRSLRRVGRDRRSPRCNYGRAGGGGPSRRHVYEGRAVPRTVEVSSAASASTPVRVVHTCFPPATSALISPTCAQLVNGDARSKAAGSTSGFTAALPRTPHSPHDPFAEVDPAAACTPQAIRRSEPGRLDDRRRCPAPSFPRPDQRSSWQARRRPLSLAILNTTGFAWLDCARRTARARVPVARRSRPSGPALCAAALSLRKETTGPVYPRRVTPDAVRLPLVPRARSMKRSGVPRARAAPASS